MSGFPLSSSEGRALTKYLRFLPTKRQIGVWLRAHQFVPPRQSRFRVLVTDLEGDDDRLSRTRHLETMPFDQMAPAILPVGGKPGSTVGAIDAGRLERCRSLLAGHNGDSLIFGDVVPDRRCVRIHAIGRCERDAGRHGPYQLGWTELPEPFGPDTTGLLQTLIALSLSPATQDDRDRACLINMLRPAATRLTRLLERPDLARHTELQGTFWHALGLAASLLGDYTRSRRWLEVGIHAYRTALLIWREKTATLPWATVQNNLGHALRLLADQYLDRPKQIAVLEQSVDAFQQAIGVYRTDGEMSACRRQTKTNLAHAETLLLQHPSAA